MQAHEGIESARLLTEDDSATCSLPACGSSAASRHDGLREIAETVAIVALIWLLVKVFVAEPFVIPSSSMAGTLYGFQKVVTCAGCGKPFAVDCSNEKEPKEGRFKKTTSCKCQNCELTMDLDRRVIDSAPGSGDRVVVLKFPEDLGLCHLNRFDVVVFRCPEELQKNFIKRLIGLPGETVAIHRGDIYISKTYQPPEEKQDASRPLRHRWRKETRDHDQVSDYLKKNGFQIIRKPPDKLLSMRWLVYDHDYPPPDLPSRWEKVGTASSWHGEDRLTASSATGASDPAANFGIPRRFRHVSGSDEISWLRYQHYVRRYRITDKAIRAARGAGVPSKVLKELERCNDGELTREEFLSELSQFIGAEDQDRYQDIFLRACQAPIPQLVRDLISYNSNEPDRGGGGNWVGDLLLECEVTVEQPQGEFIMELSKGGDRFRATWNFASGECVLSRKGCAEPLARAETGFKTGSRRLRFANVDQRLTIWVDNKLPFGNGVAYDPLPDLGPSRNDLEPARLGARGADLTVKHLSLWRDTYYTMTSAGTDASGTIHASEWSDPGRPGPLHQLGVAAFYVQPDHYFCLGDNSPHSSDSRCWKRIGDNVETGGLVPKNLMLGRAVGIFYPFSRFGLIR